MDTEKTLLERLQAQATAEEVRVTAHARRKMVEDACTLDDVSRPFRLLAGWNDK